MCSKRIRNARASERSARERGGGSERLVGRGGSRRRRLAAQLVARRVEAGERAREERVRAEQVRPDGDHVAARVRPLDRLHLRLRRVLHAAVLHTACTLQYSILSHRIAIDQMHRPNATRNGNASTVHCTVHIRVKLIDIVRTPDD